jgi:predicted molibdopterin-dependent oxidoreductase YjgC
MNPVTLTIDGVGVNALPGQSVLAAARSLGIDIPTLCYLEKCGPLNSCLVCLVKINGKLVPACGTKVQPGMIVESETEEVHQARRTALELLFSDHIGDCLAPCHRLCPLGLNIPAMIRQVHSGDFREANTIVRNALPLAGILGRLCHHP